MKSAVLHFWDPLGWLRGNVQWSSLAYCKARSRLPITINWIFFP